MSLYIILYVISRIALWIALCIIFLIHVGCAMYFLYISDKIGLYIFYTL